MKIRLKVMRILKVFCLILAFLVILASFIVIQSRTELCSKCGRKAKIFDLYWWQFHVVEFPYQIEDTFYNTFVGLVPCENGKCSFDKFLWISWTEGILASGMMVDIARPQVLFYLDEDENNKKTYVDNFLEEYEKEHSDLREQLLIALHQKGYCTKEQEWYSNYLFAAWDMYLVNNGLVSEQEKTRRIDRAKWIEFLDEQRSKTPVIIPLDKSKELSEEIFI